MTEPVEEYDPEKHGDLEFHPYEYQRETGLPTSGNDE